MRILNIFLFFWENRENANGNVSMHFFFGSVLSESITVSGSRASIINKVNRQEFRSGLAITGHTDENVQKRYSERP